MYIITGMSNNEAPSERVRLHRQIKNRLRTAAMRLDNAQIERTWAIVSAHEHGLSVRQIAAVTGLSSTRIHQLLTSPQSQQIPRWLSQMRELHELDDPSTGPAGSAEIAPQPGDNSSAAWLEAEVGALRQCIGWLEQLERGEPVVVNLRLETEGVTEFVNFDAQRIRRVLARIAADLDEVARRSSAASVDATAESEDALVLHRRRLAEPPEQPRRLGPYEERNALRAEAGLLPK
jgi:hypothetical protein